MSAKLRCHQQWQFALAQKMQLSEQMLDRHALQAQSILPGQPSEALSLRLICGAARHGEEHQLPPRHPLPLDRIIVCKCARLCLRAKNIASGHMRTTKALGYKHKQWAPYLMRQLCCIAINWQVICAQDTVLKANSQGQMRGCIACAKRQESKCCDGSMAASLHCNGLRRPARVISIKAPELEALVARPRGKEAATGAPPSSPDDPAMRILHSADHLKCWCHWGLLLCTLTVCAFDTLV